MTAEQKTPKIIQLYGPGQGKTYLANVLLDHYRRHGISCTRHFPEQGTGHLTPEDKAAEYVIVENHGHGLDLDDDSLIPWMRIYFGPENRGLHTSVR